MDFSYSSLSKYSQCPKAFEIYKMQGLEKKYANYKLLLGQLVHKAIETHITGGDPNAAMDGYIAEYVGQYLHDPDMVEDSKKKAVQLFTYMKDGLTKWKFLAVEKEINIDLENGNRIIGFIDAIIETEEGEKFILDWKTRGRFKGAEDEQHNIQLAIYQEALARQGEIIDGVMIVQIATTGKPRVEVLPMYRDRETVKRMFEEVVKIAKAASDDLSKFTLTNIKFNRSGLMSGGCQYCEYKIICNSEIDGLDLDKTELFQLKKKGR